MKATKGTRLPSGDVVLKGKTVQTMRCPRCSTQSASTTGANGKPVFKCPSCGAQFTGQKF